MTPPPARPADGPALPVGGWPDRWSAARVDDGLTRLGITTPLQRDGALSVAVLLVSLVLVAALFAAPRPVGVPAVPASAVVVVVAVPVAQALLLCVRRAHPVLCLLAVTALQIALPVVVPGGDGARLLASLVAAYTCGARLTGGRAAGAVAAAAGLESAGTAVVAAAEGMGPVAVAGHALSGLLSYGGAAAVGAFVTTRRQYVELLRARAAEAVRAQRARTDAAIRAERARMARELHDVAAHHLSGMVVQTAVVERLIDRDPPAAREAAAWVRRQGKETLRDLRLVVAALREPADGPGDPDDGAPVPGLAALDRLVDAARDLGTPVEVVRGGSAPDLPPIADVTVYRVVQEALANAREHAPGAPVRVVLHHDGSAVRLEVVDGGAPVPGNGGVPADEHRGFGLVGMRERAQMLGASFDAGPTADGGWRVALVLPLDGRAGGAAAEGGGTGR